MNTTQNCSNCGHIAEGRYCQECGQSTHNFKQPLSKFLAEFASEALSLDSRLASTIKPLFLHPGLVAAEFVAGKRARFVPPARLYIFASFAMFLTLAFSRAPVTVTTTTRTDSSEVAADTTGGLGVLPDTTDSATGVSDGSNFLGDRFGRGLQRLADNPAAFRREFFNRMAQAMFFLVPVFAVLLKLLYRSRLYVEHLVYSVYFHTVVFLVVAAINLPSDFGLFTVTRIGSVVFLGLPIYLFVGMRRMYQESRFRTTLKLALIGASYSLFVVATSFLVLGLTLVLL